MNETQISRYLRAVRRRLTLPKKQKNRVMDDLHSSIEERREAGQTEAEILAALGSARQTAEELTAQMSAYAYRKSPWRFACLAAAALALPVLLTLGSWALRGSKSVGVIGGADGPTAIFVTTPAHRDWTGAVIAAVILALGIAGYFLLRRLPPKQD